MKRKPDARIYRVVVNQEGMSSIWPADRENALVWNDTAFSGTRDECFTYILQAMQDARPRLRPPEGERYGE